MATQLAEPIGQEADNDTQSGARDYVAEAKQHGWTPKEDFKGDPARWVDAETFVAKADEVMPLLKKKTEVQDRRIADLEKTIKQQAKFMEGAEKRSYDRAVAELKIKKRSAVEAGDTREVDALDDEIDKLKADATAGAKQDDIAEQAQEAYADWRLENRWYDKGALASASDLESDARVYADILAGKNQKKADSMAPADFFAWLGEQVLEKYPALNGKGPRPKPASDVAGVTAGRANGSAKGYSDLPNDAKQMCDRLIRRGAIPGADEAAKRAYYAKNYDWSS